MVPGGNTPSTGSKSLFLRKVPAVETGFLSPISLIRWQPSATSSLHHLPTASLHPHTFNSSFLSLLTKNEVSKFLCTSHPATCPLDLIPFHLQQEISTTLLPAFTHIINTSLTTGNFLTAFNHPKKHSVLQNIKTTNHYKPNFRTWRSF